ncbi:hypothetical protein RCJ22_39590 [Vibrio sp. FNV 38]|nr:hypothetical protein [Vibrio sp. FNV 38]
MTDLSHTHIDVPFHLRHTCWFCGEPSADQVCLPKTAQSLKLLEHEALAIPACDECAKFGFPGSVRSIYELRDCIKHSLIDKYAKHLGIGENWTQQELQNSEFTGAILEGFGRSAWEMYQIARERVDYVGWAVVVNEMPILAYDDTSGFTFNKTRFPSLSACIHFYTKAAGVDKELLTELVRLVTPSRFAYALQIAKLNKRVSNIRRDEILEEVRQQESEQEEIAIDNANAGEREQSDIEAITVAGATAPVFAIQWALQNRIHTLAVLCEHEDDYFDKFAHLGGTQAYMTYHGLQLYFEARQDPAWVEAHDTNRDLWSAC